MRCSLAELLEESRQDELPLWSFTVYNFELAAAVLSAAESLRIPVVLLVSEQAARSKSGGRLIDMLVTMSTKSSTPCCVELDHAKDLQLIESGLAKGMSAVMADGAGLDFVHNVEFVTAARVIARGYGASVEAELGRLSGAEDSLRSDVHGALTRVGEVARFVSESRPDCLAVSVGNVHGRYEDVPRLHWGLLDEIRSTTEIPLALHGVSGLSIDDLGRAIRAGVTKLNVNTELRESYFREGRRLHDVFVGDLDVLGASTVLTERMELAVTSKIQALRDALGPSPGTG